jgi:amino-acid N-acetyltransferase
VTRLRPALPEDRAAVEALLASAHLPLEGVVDHFAGFVVVEEDGELVGAAGLEVHGDYGLLRSVVVAPHASGRGLGRRMTDHVLRDVERRGLRSVYLLTTTADAYFAKLGFTRVGREDVPEPLLGSEELRGACPASAVVMCNPRRSGG